MVDAHDRLRAPEHAALEPSDGDLALVIVVGRRRHEQLRRRLGVHIGRGDALDDRVEQRLERGADVAVVRARRAGDRVRVDRRELGLLVRGTEVEEQVERLIQHVHRARVRTIDLVDDHDRAVAAPERLAQHEFRLRHRPIDRVDEKKHAVDHVHDPFDLAAEIGVAGRVDDVDLRPAIHDRGVLRHDRDAALALERVRVHDALGHLLVVTEDVALPEHGVDQRRLPVVDVRDDRDVADVGPAHG